MAVALFFQSPVEPSKLKNRLIELDGFQDFIEGYRKDHNTGEMPGRVAIALPDTVLFHAQFLPEEATSAFQGAAKFFGIDESQLRYIAIKLDLPLDGSGLITNYLPKD